MREGRIEPLASGKVLRTFFPLASPHALPSASLSLSLSSFAIPATHPSLPAHYPLSQQTEAPEGRVSSVPPPLPPFAGRKGSSLGGVPSKPSPLFLHCLPIPSYFPILILFSHYTPFVLSTVKKQK